MHKIDRIGYVPLYEHSAVVNTLAAQAAAVVNIQDYPIIQFLSATPLQGEGEVGAILNTDATVPDNDVYSCGVPISRPPGANTFAVGLTVCGRLHHTANLDVAMIIGRPNSAPALGGTSVISGWSRYLTNETSVPELGGYFNLQARLVLAVPDEPAQPLCFGVAMSNSSGSSCTLRVREIYFGMRTLEVNQDYNYYDPRR